MICLAKTELLKVWQSRIFRIALAALLCVNLFLLWVGTSPANGAFTSHAYNTMQQNLHGLTMDEKSAFINEELRRITAFSAIDSVLRTEAYNNGKPDEYLRKEYAAELEEFYDEYATGNILKYNSTITDEYRFLVKIQAECETVAGYDAFLTDIEKKANQLSSISIFAESADGYDLKNINKTALAYKGMGGIKIDYFPQMGLFTALDFALSDLIFVFAMLLIATVLVRQERDSGLLNLLRATPAGRLKTAVAKLFALSISLLLALMLIYGVNLLYCGMAYGLGDLSRSIQSVPALMRSTLKLNVLEYLGLFLLTKWVAALAAGVFVMLCMLMAKRAFGGYAVALGFLGANLLIRGAVAATSNLNVLKYANLISLSRTNELIGGYRNLYFFAQPVSIWLIEGVTAALCLAAFTAAFCLCFSRAYFGSANRSLRLPSIFKQKRFYVGITKTEAHKLFIMNGAALFLVVFAGYQLYSAVTTKSYINPDEIYYSYYIKNVQGPVTQEKIDWLSEEYKEFEPIILLQNSFNRGEITPEQYSVMMSSYYSLQQKMSAFMRVWYKQAYFQTHPRAQFVYESAWLKLFDMQGGSGYQSTGGYSANAKGVAAGDADRMDALIASLMCAACFAGLFAMEKQSGMERIVAATPLGRQVTVKAKLKCSAAVCAVLSVLSVLPRFIVVIRDYGLGAFFAPSYSMERFDKMTELPLFFYLFLFIGARYLAIRAMAGVVHCLSHKTGNMIYALFAGSAVLSLPLLLSVSGLNAAKYLSVYPLFNAAAMFSSKGEAFACMLYAALFGCIIYISNVYLYDNFGKSLNKK